MSIDMDYFKNMTELTQKLETCDIEEAKEICRQYVLTDDITKMNLVSQQFILKCRQRLTQANIDYKTFV